MDADFSRGKRKSEGDPDGDDVPSPLRRGGGGLTLEAVTALLATQTREIKEGTSQQISEALKNLEEKTLKRMDRVEDKVEKLVREQDGKIGDLRQTTETLLERVKRLEERPLPASVGSSTTAGDDRRALVIGGWKAETHRDLILSDFRSLVKELELEKLLDGDYFVPGLKHNVVIVPIAIRDKEMEHEARQRMLKIVQTVREARLQTQNLPENASVWAAVSKPRAARQLAAHAGKVRKCLYLLEVDARNSECEYATGSVLMWTLLTSFPFERVITKCRIFRTTVTLVKRDTSFASNPGISQELARKRSRVSCPMLRVAMCWLSKNFHVRNTGGRC